MNMKDPPYQQELQILGQLLTTARKEAGISQEGLAEIVGKPQSYISRYEAGSQRLDVFELRRICRAIGIPFMDMMANLDAALGKKKRRKVQGRRRRGPSRKRE